MPARQASQSPADRNVPAGQDEEHSDAAADEYVLAAQAMHVVDAAAPVDDEYRPAGQLLHPLAPEYPTKDPAGHD